MAKMRWEKADKLDTLNGLTLYPRGKFGDLHNFWATEEMKHEVTG